MIYRESLSFIKKKGEGKVIIGGKYGKLLEEEFNQNIQKVKDILHDVGAGKSISLKRKAILSIKKFRKEFQFQNKSAEITLIAIAFPDEYLKDPKFSSLA